MELVSEVIIKRDAQAENSYFASLDRHTGVGAHDDLQRSAVAGSPFEPMDYNYVDIPPIKTERSISPTPHMEIVSEVVITREPLDEEMSTFSTSDSLERLDAAILEELEEKTEKFVPSALCRLCEFPAGSDGVRLSDVDILKLSRWWKNELETDFEDEETHEKYFCQFCIWDAKFQGEHKKAGEGCDWWTGLDTDKFYEKFYYQKELLGACAVAVARVAIPQDACLFCGARFGSKAEAFRHVLRTHRTQQRFPCAKCQLHFRSAAERKQHNRTRHPASVCCHLCERRVAPSLLQRHVAETHSSARGRCCGKLFSDAASLAAHFASASVQPRVRCVLCGKLRSYYSMGVHVRLVHAAHGAVRCPYRRCATKYFRSELERQRHAAAEHESKPGLLQCPHCPCKIARNLLARHLAAVHHAEALIGAEGDN